LLERGLRFLIQNAHRPGEQRIGFLAIIANGRQTDAPVRVSSRDDPG